MTVVTILASAVAHKTALAIFMTVLTASCSSYSTTTAVPYVLLHDSELSESFVVRTEQQTCTLEYGKMINLC